MATCHPNSWRGGTTTKPTARPISGPTARRSTAASTSTSWPEPMTADAAVRMERMYRWQRHIYDASRKYYLWGRDRLISELDLGPEEHLLEIGCGTARNLIVIAERYPEARLYGFDAADAMLEVGRAKVAKAGLDDRIRLAFGLAGTGIERVLFDRPEGYDRIVFSYSLSMFDDPTGAIDSAVAALAPGGRLHVVDFGVMQGLPAPLRWLLVRWLESFHVHPSSAAHDRLAERRAADGAALDFQELAGGYAQLMTYRLPPDRVAQ
ncbi:MAG: methyltransferase [Geminicoccaceae bacterium]|nr:MAG: methyltransferase [Geminicoccaceae bacterium]